MTLVRRGEKGSPVSAAEYDAVVDQVENNQDAVKEIEARFIDAEVTLSFGNLAEATADWTEKNNAGNTPSNDVLIFLEDLKEDYKWDSTVPAKAVATGRTFFEKALPTESLEDSEKFSSDGQVYDKVKKEFIDSIELSLISKPNLVNSKNLFLMKDVIPGFYINYNTGSIVPNSGYSYVKIDLLPSTTYNWSVDDSDSANLEQFAWEEFDGTYVSGNAGGSKTITFTTSAETSYGLFSINNSKLDMLYMLEKGVVRTSYELPYSFLPFSSVGFDLKSKEYVNRDLQQSVDFYLRKNIIVDINGGGDYVNLRTAIESNLSYGGKGVNIFVKSGVYDIMSYYSEAEITAQGFKGMDIPDNFYLILDKDTELKGELTELVYNSTYNQRVSTVNFIGSGGILDGLVTAKNLQYAIHDDVNLEDVNRELTTFAYHYNGLGFGQAYGGGGRSGGKYNFKNFRCHTEMRSVNPEKNIYPFSFHNNVNFENPISLKLHNCKMTSYTGGVSMAFGNLGSNQVDEIELIGNTLQGNLLFFEEVTGSGVGIQSSVTGYGNTPVPIEVIDSTNEKFSYLLNEETVVSKNKTASVVSAFSLVKRSSNNQGVVPITSDSVDLFFGITLSDSISEAEVVVQFSGYFPIAYTNLTALNIGDRIGIVSGVLAVVTGTDYIGFVENTDYIKLK